MTVITRNVNAIRYAILIALVVVVEIAARAGAVDVLSLVPPTEMFSTMVDLLVSGELADDFQTTVVTTFVAFIAASFFGIIAGAVLWSQDTLKQILDPYLIAYYAMPIFVFYPMLIAIFGFNKTPIILIAFAMSVIAIIINTANGFNNVPDVYRKLARSHRLTRTETFRHVFIPSAAPYIFTGLKLGFVYAFIGVLASEFILANTGLGYRVAFSYQNFRTGRMYAVMLFIVLIAIVTNEFLRRIEERLHRRAVSER